MSSKEIANEIACYLEKHAGDSKRVEIVDYEFTVLGLTNVKVNPESIHETYENSFHFNGSATIHRYDPQSTVSDNGKKAIINGVAFYAEDTEGDTLLYHITIENISAEI